MYKNQRRRTKRPGPKTGVPNPAADPEVVVVIENEVLPSGSKKSKSPRKSNPEDTTGLNAPVAKKKSKEAKSKLSKGIVLSNSEDETLQKGKEKSLQSRRSSENEQSKISKKIVILTQKKPSDITSSEDEEPQRGKRKSLRMKSSENGNSKGLKKLALLKQKACSENSSTSEDEEPQRGKGKSLERKRSTENGKSKSVKKVVTLTQKIAPENASTSEDEEPQRGKGKSLRKRSSENGGSKGMKKVAPLTQTAPKNSSTSEDEEPQRGKGKSLEPKRSTENANSKSLEKVVVLTQKNAFEDSSSEDEVPLLKEKGKSLKQVVTSTQKSASETTNSEDEELQRGQKRSSDTANLKGPAAKRSQKASSRFPDFPPSLAASTIFSPSSSPEKRPIAQSGSLGKRTNAPYRNTGHKRTDNPFFDRLSSLGFTIGEGEESNCLDRDQASFVRSLDLELRNDKTYPKNVDEFVQHFETFMNESPENLRKVLQNTQSSDDYARKSVQECLVRLLLNVDCIQPKLWGMLLSKISELAIEEDEDPGTFELLHRIIRQMRCLDRVVEGNVNICDELFTICDLASKEETKRELILLLPDVISEDDHERAAQTISAALTNNHELIPAYLDTLSSLSLSEDSRKTVVDKVIDILSRADTKFFQVIIRFLLMTADNLEPVIRGIRKHIVLDPNEYGNDGNEGIMLAAALKEVENKKALVATWIDLMDESETQEWLAVDFVALLVNFSKVKKAVMSAFKKLALRGAKGEKDIEKVYPSIKSILEQDYLDTMRQVLDNLFKSRSADESRHATFWYRLLLNRIETCHDSQKVLDDIMSHIGHSAENPTEVSLALNSLEDAANENKDSVARHTQRILTLMHNIEAWPLEQVRQVMNLLLSLVYHKEGASGMQDTMTITIRKHINHPSFNWRSKGIVGMVAQLKHMPAGSALSQLKVVFDVAENFSSEARGLLYDELASACEELHPDVSDELRNIILQAFEDSYVINLEDADSEARVCYEIVRSDSPLAIPFVGGGEGVRSPTMCAQLRLIHRMLAVHEALEDVSALLACAVVLPNADAADFALLGASQRKEVVDSYFCCINFFRELVNGFSRDRDCKSTVVKRLEQIIEMNATVAKLLAITYDYVPPQCQFFHAAKAPVVKRPKAKGKGKAPKGKKGKNRDDTSCSKALNKDDSDDEPVNARNVPADISLYRDFFRDLDMNVFVLLNCPLRTADESAETISISADTMKFLLSDYVSKLESMFTVRAPSPFRKQGPSSTAMETTRSAKYCIKLVTLLRCQLEATTDYCKNLLSECCGVHDSHEMFKAGSAEVKECTTLLLRCLHALVVWPGFHASQNTAMRDDLLAKLTNQKVSAEADWTANAVSEAFGKFVKLADSIVHLPGAVALLKLLKELSGFAPAPRRTRAINDLSQEFLQRPWYDLVGEEEKANAKYNDHIEALLTFHAQSLPAEHRLKHVTQLVQGVEKEQENMESGDSLSSFTTVTKQNFHVMFKTLCLTLTAALKLAKTIADWSKLADALASLTAIMLHLKNWKNQKHFAKLTLDFLVTFLKRGKGMDLLNKNPSEGANVLKTVQTTTRFVHRIIHDAKAKKDVSLSAIAPLFRRNQDALIMRVKAMCAACPEAFSSGNLRNKNLAGDEIGTQEMEDFDTPVFEADDSEIDDDVAEANEDGEEDESDISVNI